MKIYFLLCSIAVAIRPFQWYDLYKQNIPEPRSRLQAHVSLKRIYYYYQALEKKNASRLQRAKYSLQ